MAEGKQFSCPVCGWTLITPKGEEDLMKHVDMHGKEYHADMPMTPDQVRSATKTVNMPEPMKQRSM
jgi:predicted small metal-binding protein